jgi:hypothetical protein
LRKSLRLFRCSFALQNCNCGKTALLVGGIGRKGFLVMVFCGENVFLEVFLWRICEGGAKSAVF